jgi:threonine dehydratase
MELYQRIEKAYQRINQHIQKTPFERSIGLSQICESEVFFKCEHLQTTGSFKFRGATNKIMSLPESERQKGIITASSGNHGIASALAAKKLNTQATIYTPASASPMKLNNIEKLGGIVKKVDGDCMVGEMTARETAAKEGKEYISPYNDIDVVAGQGTLGLEISQQCKDLDAVFVSVGGGGLISGVGGYLKYFNPNIQVVGCWPENSAAMYQSIQAGKIVEAPEIDTISDGTAGPVEPGSITFPFCQQFVDQHALVTETEICAAMRLIAEHERWIVEGAAGVALAGLLKNILQFKNQKVGVVLCGRNILLEKYIAAITK